MNQHSHSTSFNPIFGAILLVTEPYTFRAILWIMITLVIMWAGSNALDVLFKKKFRVFLSNLKNKTIKFFKRNERNRG